eukprot:GFYU01047494.1.p2 GENE.GFYU01047494.1~~GFYU01047494.1.p2  ORF type:complete len:114 (-),score=0.99 GFYU01047494.1:340-681(-)
MGGRREGRDVMVGREDDISPPLLPTRLWPADAGYAAAIADEAVSSRSGAKASDWGGEWALALVTTLSDAYRMRRGGRVEEGAFSFLAGRRLANTPLPEEEDPDPANTTLSMTC